MDDEVPPTVVSPHDTLQPTVRRDAPQVPAGAADDSSEKTPPTILLNQERLLAQVPRTQHGGKEAPMLGGVPLVSKIGQGGMGAVYLGICPRSGESVAVKVLPLQMEDQTHAIDRFLREARLATVVKSPHLVAVREVGHDGGLYFFQMEFVRGKSAGAYLRAQNAESGAGGAVSGAGIDESTALDICIAATQGLAAAHAAEIIHRDIKPDNILIPEDPATGELLYEKAKLADLGLARSLADDQTMTATQTALGTPGYMAPEQCRDAKRAELTADIFSMGATLYALLAGRPPFQGRTSVDTILATLTRQHMPIRQFRADVSEMTHEVIERCLSKEPRIRYENAGKLLEALLTCRDLRKGLSTLGLGLRAPVPAGTAATVHEAGPSAHSTHAPAPQLRPANTPAAAPRASRGPNVAALVLGTALVVGTTVWMLRSPDEKPVSAAAPSRAVTPTAQSVKPQRESRTEVAPAPAPGTGPVETVSAPQRVSRKTEDAPTPAELLLQRIHEGTEKMPVKAAPAKSANPITAEPATTAAKAPDAEEVRRQKALKQWREELVQAEKREEKLERETESARQTLQKAKSDFEYAQREMERVQNEERGLRDQVAQMEMKMRSAPPPPKQGGRKPGGGGPQQDPRVQQMQMQFNEMQMKLRERQTQAQTLVRDRSQAMNQAMYEVQKLEGLQKQAAAEVQRLREKLDLVTP